MATFVRGQPITTREPTIKVDAGLAVGVHRFQLVVLTDTGQKSAPVIAEVSIQRTILDPTRPILDTGVLTPTIPTRPRIDSTPVRPHHHHHRQRWHLSPEPPSGAGEIRRPRSRRRL